MEELGEEDLREMYRKDEVTVQGALESAIWQTLTPHNPVKLSTSCRTDTGVHALNNTGHVDLLPSQPGGIYHSPRNISRKINSWLIKR